MSHLSDDFDDTFYPIGVADIFVRFIECDPFVERLALILRPGENSQKHHKKPQRLVRFDEFIAQIYNNETTRIELVSQMCTVSYELFSKPQPKTREILLGG